MTFFGIPINVDEAWMFTICGSVEVLWSAYELRKAAVHNRIGFKGRDYHRNEKRFEFNLYRGLWALILFCSFFGLIGYHFNLSIKP